MTRRFLAAPILFCAFIAACQQGEKTPASAPAAAAAAASSGAQTGTDLTPDDGGKVVVVTASTEPDGTNRFTPAEFTVKRGDVIRYTLKVGVHNVDFVADSNPGKTGLPSAPSDMLQLPGQTYDVKVSFAPGTYYFQCDPHALLGMKGHVTVK
jgi:plastocyanin